MNVNDLRAVLREQAETVADHDDVRQRRVVGVDARIRGARRRRIAGAAALTVGALAVVGVTLPAWLAAPADQRPGSSDLPAPLPTVRHEGFVTHSGEFDLVAATVGDDGQSTLALTVPAHTEELHVALSCSGVSGPPAGYWVSGYAGDSRPARPHSKGCGDDPYTPVEPGVVGSAPGPWRYEDGLRLGPSTDPVTVHVELTRQLDDGGLGAYEPVTNPGVVLGIGVYKVAEPVVTVAGTEIRPRVGLDGEDYAYVEHRLSQPGQRTLTWTLPPSDAVHYYDVVSDNSTDPRSPTPGVRLSQDGGACAAEWSMPRYRAGGCLLSAGRPHTITVTLDPGLPADAVVGIVLYQRTG